MEDTTLNILDHKITVKNEDPGVWENGGMGRSSILNSKISINSKLPTDVKRNTFIHELIHWVHGTTGVTLSEQDVEGLTLGINSFITNNLDWINDTWKSK